jgi:hypothetical protein
MAPDPRSGDADPLLPRFTAALWAACPECGAAQGDTHWVDLDRYAFSQRVTGTDLHGHDGTA